MIENTKEIKIPSGNRKLISLSDGYFIVKLNYDLKLYKLISGNLKEIDEMRVECLSTIVIKELKNKTIVLAGRGHTFFYKIKNDKIIRTIGNNFDNNQEYFAEIVNIKELENEQLIALDILGNIFIMEKIEDFTQVKLYEDSGDYKNQSMVGKIEYFCAFIIFYVKRYIRNILLYSKGNIVFFKEGKKKENLLIFSIEYNGKTYEKSI